MGIKIEFNDPHGEEILEFLRDFKEKIMATLADFQKALSDIDTETTRIANKIQELLDKLAAGGLTPAEETEIHTKVGQHLDRLKGIGASVENPIPPPVPPETPV